MKKITLLSLFILILGCKKQTKQEEVQTLDNKETVVHSRPVALENGKFFEIDGKKMLYGGENENEHFDII